MKSSKQEHWIDVVKAKDKKKPTVNSYPPELRGFAQIR
jgi:hypothetical protein